jgi:hypothetical protein
MAWSGRGLKRTSIRILAIGVAAYFGLLAILYVSQRDLLYYPNDIVPDPAAHGVPEMAVHRVEPEAGIQPLIWWAPPKNPSLPVIVYFHGNGGHLGSRAGRARIYLKAGYGLLLAGYRYNAGAGGEASEDGLLADAPRPRWRRNIRLPRWFSTVPIPASPTWPRPTTGICRFAGW